ncbi:MAG: tetratricopeptide repeat protein [Gemmataceae bacterium]|nr:tetratricopeptide repeat protein [Gemmata sp.]MDW8198869.1 tetratricopeptide repeat protein [Gemmataceae bacterium]
MNTTTEPAAATALENAGTAAEAEAAATAATAPREPIASPVSGRRKIGVPIVLLLCLMGGAVGQFMLQKKWHPPAEAADDATNSAVATTPEFAPHSVLMHIDTLIRAGCYAEALAVCQASASPPTAADARSWSYREAVCLEALGRLKEAVAAYHRAEPPRGDQAAWARALLGQARCAVARGDLVTAQNLVDRVLLRSGHPDCNGTAIGDECRFVQAQLEALRLGPVRALDPLDAEAVAWPALTGQFDRYYDWLPPDTPPTGSAGPSLPNALELRPATDVPGGYEVTAHLAERPIVDLLQHVAQSLQRPLQLDASVTPTLAHEVTAVNVESLPLADFLAALTRRFGLRYHIEPQALIVQPGVTPPARATVAQAFQRLLATAPAHPLAASIQVWLGNFYSLDGCWHEAARAYQHVVEQSPTAMAEALYNLGLAELRLGLFSAARSRFINLVDHAPRTKWVDYAWWWVGRTHLDTGDITTAQKFFTTARDSRTREVISAATLGLCLCEWLKGSDHSIRAWLEETRFSTREAHGQLVAFMEALQQYRRGPSDSRRARLLQAIGECNEGRDLGPAGFFFVGQVYRELHHPEKMVLLYDRATASLRGPLAIQMTFAAAEWYFLHDKREAARSRYFAIAATDPQGLGPQAELRLAEIAFRDGEVEECLKTCRRLVHRAGVDPAEVLKLMGRAYETLRQYRQAAECFAGRVPND